MIQFWYGGASELTPHWVAFIFLRIARSMIPKEMTISGGDE
jgi:hypothetical protein